MWRTSLPRTALSRRTNRSFTTSSSRCQERVHPASQRQSDLGREEAADAASSSKNHQPPFSTEKIDHQPESSASARFREWTRRVEILASNSFSKLGGKINKVSGYDEIEGLKRLVSKNEELLKEARDTARAAKRSYESAVLARSTSQREVNDLLQRKSSWTESDVTRFTSLIREDHLVEQTETRTRTEVQAADDNVERAFGELMRSILGRYHEEQVWSDKIRSAATYGSLAAMGLNVVVFLLAIVLVEPYKRRRLAQTFERRVEGLADDLREEMRKVVEKVGQRQEIVMAALKLPVDHEILPPPQPVIEKTLEGEDKEMLDWWRRVPDSSPYILGGAMLGSMVTSIAMQLLR